MTDVAFMLHSSYTTSTGVSHCHSIELIKFILHHDHDTLDTNIFLLCFYKQNIVLVFNRKEQLSFFYFPFLRTLVWKVVGKYLCGFEKNFVLHDPPSDCVTLIMTLDWSCGLIGFDSLHAVLLNTPSTVDIIL